MKIEIAGAGAGKTTNLAQKIINKHEEIASSKNIYCISYTNKSKEKILSKLEEHYLKLPENIIVSTIHSFLNQEIIKPFHYSLYNEHYSDISNSVLPNDPKYKNIKLRDLRNKGYLHVDEFTNYAKYVICGKSNDRKAIKLKREELKNILGIYMGAIFVDEAQDIDENTKKILIELHDMNIHIELVGDPKQDLKGYKQLNELTRLYPENVSYVSDCFRCPESHLIFSNRFIPESESQSNSEKTNGEINYIFESEITNIYNFCKTYDLKYIYQKNKRFNTQSSSKHDLVYEELKYIVGKYNLNVENKNSLLQIASRTTVSLYFLINEREYSINKAINQFYPYGVLSKSDYKRLEEAIQRSIVKEKIVGIKVSSIQSIKGLEGETCLFIITPAMVPYLKNTGNKIKMKSHWYVALTRAQEQLTMLISKEIEDKYGQQVIINIFKQYGISRLELNN